MSRGFTPSRHRTPEEEERGINQIENPFTAKAFAKREKPIRDIARDPETDPRIRELKPLLDKEAERIVEKEFRSLELPIDSITLSSIRRTTSFFMVAKSLEIEALADLTKISYNKLLSHGLIRPAADELVAWVEARGFRLADD